LLSLVTNFGLFASTLVSWIVIPTLGWRAMFVIAGVGAFFVLWLRRAMPESPRWLAVMGRTAEADVIVRAVEAEAAHFGSLPPPPVAPVVAGLSRGEFIRRVIVGSVIQMVVGAAIYGFVAWVPTFLVQHGMAINRSLGQAVLMSFGGPAGAALAYLLTDRIGRRPAIIGASLLAAVCGPAFAHSPSQAIAVLLGFIMFSLIYFIVSVTVAGYIPELFPTAVRMRGNGLANMAGRLATIFVPFAVVALYQSGGVSYVLSAIAVALVAQAVMVLCYRQETNGRSLEAIGADPAQHSTGAADVLPLH
jgi:MFS transporter, putative metabolite:H+ symporter